jgi:alpha-tubulin suppressor-like RCC1 family protein
MSHPLRAFHRLPAISLVVAALAAACGDPAGPKTEPVATVTVSPSAPTLNIGGTVMLSAVTRDASGTELTGRSVSWSSSANNVATVSSAGLVTAVAAGTAQVTATSEGKTGSVTVTVAAVPVASVSISAPTTPMERTLTQTLTATTKDAASNVLTGRVVTWSSSAPAIASVDATTGVVTALDRGIATITATSETKTASVQVEVIILYRSITAGSSFSCDLGSIGIASCWGSNGGQDGRLGNGPLDNASLADSPVPVNVLGTQRFTTISSGARHSCGLAAAGAAYCWGSNGDGQLGAPSIPSWAHQPVAVTGNLAFTQISAGDAHTCAITAAGGAYCWGDNGVGQLGNNSTTDATSPVAVAGGIVFASISAGTSTGSTSKTCGVATNGRAYCWGSDTNGELGDGGVISYSTLDFKKVPTEVAGGFTDWKSVAVGTVHACGIRTTGAAYCWGSNNSGKLGTGNDVDDESAPKALATTQTFLQIEAGYMNTCGVTTAYALYCWGANVNGESGSASEVGQIAKAPALAAAGEWIEVNLGGSSSHTCGILRTRLSVRCMGSNDSGQLGNGATTSSTTSNPTPVLVTKQQP